MPAPGAVDRAADEITQLARIPEENPDPVFRISAGHVLLYRNPAGKKLCRVWGCRLGQRVPAPIQVLVSAALAGGAVAQHEVAFASRTYWLTVAPAVADGYVNIYARDITDHKQAEEALRQAEQKFRAIFDNTSDGILLLDLETRKFTLGNPSCLQMLGYTQDEFVHLGLQDLHFQEDLPFIYAQIEEFLAGRKGTRHDIRFKRRDGSILFVDLSPDLIVLDGRRYILVALKDITERKRMEEELRRHTEHLEERIEAATGELRESEARYRGLYHMIADGIFVVGVDGLIVDVNDSACAQLGYTREELIGMPLSAISARSDFRLEEALDRLRAAGSLSYETMHRRKDGVLIPIELSIALVEYQDQPAALGVARDITERKGAEEALRESEAGLAAAQRLAHIGSWWWDIAADTAHWSEETFRIFGVAPGPLQQHRENFVSRIVPEDRHRVDQALSDALSGTSDYDLDYRIRLPDGCEKVIHAQAQVLRSSDGRPVMMHGTVQDITERKHAEESLRESEERFRTAFEEGAVPMALTALDSTLLKVNSSFCRMLGFSESELVGRSFNEITHPDDRAANLVGTQRLACGAISSFHMTKRYIRKDGDIVWGDMNTASVRDAQGQPLYCVTHVQDVTERKQAEEALRESEERYRILLEHGFDGIFVHEDFRIVQLNDRLAEMTGYTPAELLNSRPIELFLPESQQRIRDYIRSGATGYFEAQLRRRDGRLLDVESFGIPCRFHGRQARIVGLRDITERKRAEEALRRLNERLELQVAQRTEELRHTVDRLRQLTLDLSQAEDRERERIADILHEDVQQMLAAARFHLNLLDSEPRSTEELHEIVGQVKRMLREAIEKSRNLSHELSPALYQVDLLEILNWLARHIQQRHGLTVHVEAHGPVDSPSEPLKAFLYKVVQELLFNVVKHAGVSEARIRVRRLGPCLYLSVIDRGRGFDPQRLERTTGFGLLGIRERVQLLGGRMKIRSRPGAGSRFLIAIPYDAASRLGGPAENQEGQVSSVGD